MSWGTPGRSWDTGMSWKYVVGNRDVVEVCRGEHVFSGGCRGDRGSMSWVTGMSWKYVVDNSRFLGDVVGTEVACRGSQGCRGSMSWRTHVFWGMSWGLR